MQVKVKLIYSNINLLHTSIFEIFLTNTCNQRNIFLVCL